MEISSRETNRILMSQSQGKTGMAPSVTEHAPEAKKSRQMVCCGVS